MKLTLLLFAFCAMCTPAFSQDDLMLQNFKYRINHFRAIDLNIAGGGTVLSNGVTNNNFTNTSASGNGLVRLNFLKSTDKLLLSQVYSASGMYNGNSDKSSGQESNGRYWSLSPFVSLNSKWFNGQQFLEFGLTATGGLTRSVRETNNQPGMGNTNQQYYNALFVLGLGRGRLENVTDMQNALWLNKALEANGSLAAALTNDQLNDLGRAITKGNNTRVLDARKRTQFTLATVDSFFQVNKVLAKADVHYFSNLNDILFFAFNNQRLSGSERFVRILPQFYGRKDQYETGRAAIINEISGNTQSIALSAGFNTYHPVSLVHQNNYGVAALASFQPASQTSRTINQGVPVYSITSGDILKRGGISAFYEHGIYPNTRTMIGIGINGEHGYQSYESEQSWYSLINITGNLNYFVSYRTRLLFSANAQYQNNNYFLTQNVQQYSPVRFNLNVNAGIGISM